MEIFSDHDGISEDAAAYIASAEKRLSQQVRRQFSFMVLATLLPTIVLIFVLVLVPLFFRQPTNEQLIVLLQESNSRIAELTKALLDTSPADPETITRAVEFVLRQVDLHQQAMDALEATQKQITPETQSIIQVVGSAAILALLGALGLQRLQNIDTEINNLRESIFAQSEVRAQMIKETLGAQIDDEVQKQFVKSRRDIQELLDQGRDALEQIQQSASQVQQSIQSEMQRLHQELLDVRALLDRYPWLKGEDSYRSVAKIQKLASVEEAQNLAEELRRRGDIMTAREALRAAVDQNLLGDYADFHNAFSEAMRLNDPQLALNIVDRGLACFPDDPDLVANKVKALYSLGRPFEAKEFIENWRKSKPDQFVRSWRPIVFYEDLFDGIELTDQDFANLAEAFDEVTRKLPYEIKVWAEYADLMMKRGNVRAAEDIFRRGLEFSPLSQQLNFMLGDLLLRQGRASEAVTYLEKALSVDYQDQYQHDVDQYAVRVRLAQGYEAIGEPEKAELLYRSVAGDLRANPTIREYSQNRLAAIALREGKLPEEDTFSLAPKQIIDLLKKLAGESESESALG